MIGKWLASRPRVLILDEPTRGVDVGAKAQVHRLIRQLAAEGIATLMISSELPELLAMSDRILVMREGRLVGELSGDTAQQEDVLQLALPDGQSLDSGVGRRRTQERWRMIGRSASAGPVNPSARNRLGAADSGRHAAVVASIDRGFLGAGNLRDIIIRSAPTAIVACGVMLVIVTAEIDISVGSLMALLAAVMGIVLVTPPLGLADVGRRAARPAAGHGRRPDHRYAGDASAASRRSSSPWDC